MEQESNTHQIEEYQEPEISDFVPAWSFTKNIVGAKWPFMRLPKYIIWENAQISKELKYKSSEDEEINIEEEIKRMQQSVRVFGGTLEQYQEEINTFVPTAESNPLVVKVLDMDCLKVARDIQKEFKEQPLVLNLAERWIERVTGSSHNPFYGSQEESIERRSSVYRLGLDPKYNNTFRQLLLDKNNDILPTRHVPEFGVVYLKDVPIIRHEDYKLLKRPYFVDVLAAGAIDLRSHRFDGREKEKEKYYKDGNFDEKLFIEHTKMKIRIILVAAIKLQYNYIILGALGCGAYFNPIKVVAKSFREVLEEEMFIGKFKLVTFAILGKNVNDPFMKEFSKYQPV